jgi:hypothetical protein
MRFKSALLLAGLVLLSGCTRHERIVKTTLKISPSPTPTSSEPVDLTGASEAELQKHLGQRVTVRGKFSMGGLVGPYVRYGDREISVYRKSSFSYGKEYGRMEGREVRLTGILRFEHFEPSPEQHPPDFFYFEGETVQIELVK